MRIVDAFVSPDGVKIVRIEDDPRTASRVLRAEDLPKVPDKKIDLAERRAP